MKMDVYKLLLWGGSRNYFLFFCWCVKNSRQKTPLGATKQLICVTRLAQFEGCPKELYYAGLSVDRDPVSVLKYMAVYSCTSRYVLDTDGSAAKNHQQSDTNQH